MVERAGRSNVFCCSCQSKPTNTAVKEKYRRCIVAMVVCWRKRICVDFYQFLIRVGYYVRNIKCIKVQRIKFEMHDFIMLKHIEIRQYYCKLLKKRILDKLFVIHFEKYCENIRLFIPAAISNQFHKSRVRCYNKISGRNRHQFIDGN